MPGAKIQHVLRFLNAADQRPGQPPPLHDEVEHSWRRMRAGRCADQCHGAIEFQQHQKGVQIVRRRHGVEDEIEAAGMRGHFVRVFGHHNFLGPQPQRVVALAGRCGEQHHVRAHRGGNFHAHVAKAAQTHDADLVARADIPLAQGRIGRDAGTQQRRHGSQLGRIMRDTQHERFAHHDVAGVATVRVGPGALLRTVVSAGEAVLAVLFKALRAGLAMLTAVDHAADTNQVADAKLRDLGADGGHAADDFVAWNRRIDSPLPLVSHCVEVGVADAAVEDVERDIARTRGSALESERCERGAGGLRGIAEYFWHGTGKKLGTFLCYCLPCRPHPSQDVLP